MGMIHPDVLSQFIASQGISVSTSAGRSASMPKHKFNLGDKVVLFVEEGGNRQCGVRGDNPYFPDYKSDDDTPIYGTVVDTDHLHIRVRWGNSEWNFYNHDQQNDLVLLSEFQKRQENAKKAAPPLKFTAEELDKVILPEDARRSIVSVLKQHEKADKIFNEWGLGKTIEYGRGMTMLFHGPPGTGKTWAAQCIARSIGKDLTILDNARLQSSTPGEMERNLQAAFTEAKKKQQVVMLDECDSLIMSREGMGMILSSEINCLLTEIEKFEGILILTTNRVGELDKALERRISLIVKFPKPDRDMRLKIWQRFLPKELPLGKCVDVEKLASELEITGGLIKNVVLGAARLAVSEDRDEVKMEDFLNSMRMIESGTKAFKRKSKVLRGTIDRSLGVERGEGMNSILKSPVAV